MISITVPRSSKLSYRRPAGSRSSSCLSMSIYIATYCATSESLPVSLQLTFLEARSVIQGKSLEVSNGSNIPTLAESPVLALIKRYVLQNLGETPSQNCSQLFLCNCPSDPLKLRARSAWPWESAQKNSSPFYSERRCTPFRQFTC